jgi:isoquinoline 1-oxidoreductase subunit alpha
MQLSINGVTQTIDAPPEMPLLWALRDLIGLTGTKFGCGIAQCGACTVLVDGVAQRSCSLNVGDIGTAKITTIEGVGEGVGDGKTLTKIQQAWIDEQVPQCGYCQSGMIMAVTGLLAQNKKPSDAEIDEAITNICRCGTYDRIRKAIHRAAAASAVEGA